MFGKLTMSLKEKLTSLLLSVVATLLSVFIALAIGTMFPFRIGPELAQPVPPGTVLSEKEMKQAEAAAKQRMEARLEKFREDPLHVLPDVKRAALPASWLPWLILPFFIRARHPLVWVWVLSVPAILMLTPFVLIAEMLTFAGALAVGALLSTRMRRKTVSDQ